jgi:diaminopimelate decarboxylase
LFRQRFTHLRISGLHIHIGSQITDSAPFVAAITKLAKFSRQLKKDGVELEYLNIGGGLGIIYDKETPQTAQKFAARALPLLKKTALKIIMEPGRFIVGNAGILVTKVLYIKRTPKKKFIIVDAGMNDLIRPALYDAYHTIIPLQRTEDRGQRTEKVDIVGPICESADFFAKARVMPKVKEGDYLAVMGAGAYGFSMSSNYNSRARAEEVMVAKDKVFAIRKRENYDDLMRNELIPPFLLGL